jgi:16S rRNA (cytidine1402-2'-O)-methyltransferase
VNRFLRITGNMAQGSHKLHRRASRVFIKSNFGHMVMRISLLNITLDTDMSERLIDPIRAILTRETMTALAPGLYLVATPIGNLADISLRAITTLVRANHICCEDTRHSRKLLDAYAITGHLTPYHDHNADRERPKILSWLAEGATVALISDAGTPLISDPGYKLVRDAVDAGHVVFSIPGPSAVTTALAVSGLPTDAFFFAGFLPPREAAARRRLTEIAHIPGTLVLFETATRLNTTLGILNELCVGRQLVIARELTKRFEELIRASLPFTVAQEHDWKGEFVLLLSPPLPENPSDAELQTALTGIMKQMSVRDAVEEVTRTFHVPRKMVYNLALQIRKGATDAGGE